MHAGATAFRSRRGLRLHLSNDPEAGDAPDRGGGRSSAASAHSTRRRSRSFSASRSPAGAGSSPGPPRARARGRGPRECLAGQDPQSEDRRAIGSGPFLVTAGSAGEQLTLVRNPRYWGRTRPTWPARLRFVPRGDAAGARLRGRGRRGRAHLPGSQAEALIFGSASRDPGPPGSQERLGAPCVRIGAGGHPALERKLVRQALAYGIDRVAIARTIEGSSSARHAPSRSTASSSSPTAPTTSRTGELQIPTGPGAAAARAGGLPPGPDGIYLRRASGSHSASRPRRQREAAAYARARSGQLRQVGVEVSPSFASSNSCSTRSSRAATSTSCSSSSYVPEYRRADETSSGATARRTTPGTAIGS